MMAKVNALPAHAFGRLQSASGAPKGVLREGVAPVCWSPSGVEGMDDIILVQPYSHKATKGETI